MNKLKSLLLGVVASLAVCASAESGYWTAVNTEAYSGDASPSTGNAAKYEAYWCTVTAAAQMFGGDTSLGGMTDSLAANYADVKAAVAGSANKLGAGYYGVGQYTFQQAYASAVADPLLVGDYLAVVFYGSDSTDAFRVFGAGSARWRDGNLVFDDGVAANGTVSAWNTVPEPTSGMLVVIGCALLALKRGRGKSKA